MENDLFRITRNIWQGRFASQRLLPELERNSITHIVNVGESPNQLTATDGSFVRIDWIPIEDLALIPTESAIKCIDSLHHAVCDANSNVYIHCVAGWNRSPTVLSLYLLACGMTQDTATDLISRSSYDAVPFHSKLINEPLLNTIRQHGIDNYMPHLRPEALDAPNVA